MQSMEEIDKLTKELKAHNRLIALQIARHNVNTWDKSDKQILTEMKEVSESILKWCYEYPEADYPLGVDRRVKYPI